MADDLCCVSVGLVMHVCDGVDLEEVNGNAQRHPQSQQHWTGSGTV
jgi:hypothetical protein